MLKINILPRLLFLISAIPLKFPLYWFTEINKLFTDFLWSNKKPRISYKRLTRPRKRDGLGVQDVYSYYLAYNARFPLLWAYTGQSEFGSWKWVDENILANQDKSLSLTALWYYPKTNLKIGNPLIKFSCEVVKIIQKRLPFNGAYLPSCPIWSTPVLKAGGKTLTNKSWQQRGINQVGQIVKDGYMVPFNVLKTQYDLKDVDFFAFYMYN